jgi:hypothetical protein
VSKTEFFFVVQVFFSSVGQKTSCACYRTLVVISRLFESETRSTMENFALKKVKTSILLFFKSPRSDAGAI